MNCSFCMDDWEFQVGDDCDVRFYNDGVEL